MMLWDLFKNKERKELEAKKDRKGLAGLLSPIRSSSTTKSFRVSCIQQHFSVILALSHQHCLLWQSNSKHPPSSRTGEYCTTILPITIVFMTNLMNLSVLKKITPGVVLLWDNFNFHY